MANTIRIKRSNVAGRVPAALPYGELAINAADRILYYGNSTNAPVALVAPGHAVKAMGHYTVAAGAVTASYQSKLTVARTGPGVFTVSVTGGVANDIILLAAADQFTIARTAGDAAAGFTLRARNIGVIGQPAADPSDFSIVVVGA